MDCHNVLISSIFLTQIIIPRYEGSHSKSRERGGIYFESHESRRRIEARRLRGNRIERELKKKKKLSIISLWIFLRPS